jgi:hypothetical protein
VDLDPGLRSREEYHPAGVAEYDGCAHVAGVEDVFDRENRRLVAPNQLYHAVVDLSQSLREIVARFRADHSAFHQRQRIATFLANYSVTRDRGARIDAKDHDRF